MSSRETVTGSGAEKQRADSRTDLKGPALRAFFNIAKAWSLSEDEQLKLLGIADRSMLGSWRVGQVVEVTPDTVLRISYLLGIFRAINTLLPQAERADAWVRAPNEAPLFGGRSAIDIMTSGAIGDLHRTRHYLEAQLV